MRYPYAEGARRSAILQLWRVKCRRASSAQNKAAVRAQSIDNALTVVNLILPMLVFTFSVCNSFQSYFQPYMKIDMSNVLIFSTGIVLCVSYAQYVGDFKFKAIQHRQSGHEFGALAQDIEMTAFEVGDDVIFSELGSRLERIQRTCIHVPNRVWQPVQERFHGELKSAEVKAFGESEA